MKEFEGLNKNVEVHKRVDLHKLDPFDCICVWGNYFLKCNELFSISLEEMKVLFEELDIKTEDLVEIEYFKSGMDVPYGMMVSKRCGTGRIRRERNRVEFVDVDAVLIMNNYLPVIKTKYLKHLIRIKHPEIFVEPIVEMVKKKKKLYLTRMTAQQIVDEFPEFKDKEIHELNMEYIEREVEEEKCNLDIYGDSIATCLFLHTENGVAYINTESLIRGKKDKLSKYMHGYYVSQLGYSKYKTPTEYKEAVTGSNMYKELVKNLKELCIRQ